MTQKKPVLYLIDAHGLIFRAHFAMIRTPLYNSKGFNTSAIFGFTNMLFKLVRDHEPNYLAMAFDMKGPTFRHEMFDEYKAHRPDMPAELVAQEPYIRNVVEAMNIPILQHSGFEADDVIATLSLKAVSEGFDVIIVTRDKDAFQLIAPSISVLLPMKGMTDMDLFTAPEVKAKLHVEPDQIVDYLSLVGDSSDNVPGVPGVGPKTAVQLLTEFGTLDGIFDNIASIKREKLRETLTANHELALKSRQLVTLDAAVPIEMDFTAMKMGDYDSNRLISIFNELEFTDLVRQISQSAVRSTHSYHCVDSEETFQRMLKEISAAPLVCVDVETDSLNPFSANLVGISFSCKPHEAWYIPIGHRMENDRQLDRKHVLSALAPILKDPGIAKVGHNIKYDWEVLASQGLVIEGITDDTMVGAWLLKPERRKHNLDVLTAEYLNEPKTPTEKLIGKGAKCITMDLVPIDVVSDYACEDVDTTFRLRELFSSQLRELDLMSLYDDMEIPLINVLKNMETVGIKIDKTILETLESDFKEELKRLEEEIYAEAGGEFNINSPKQLSSVLFEKLQFQTKGIKKTSLGWSTDEATLQKLIKPGLLFKQLPELLLEFRSLTKLLNTYVITLIHQIDSASGRIHTSYNQTVTETGRLSSSDPNLQNIPIRTEMGREIRKVFIAESEDWLILSADYSQVELRILAHIADDQRMKKAFHDGLDIHAHTASEIFGIPIANVDREHRRMAKTINFGIDYGMTEWGLASRLSISVDQARLYIKNYFDRYSGVRLYIENTIAFAREHGYVKTLFNRRRTLPEINSERRMVREGAERQAINMPIQGTAAEVIKIAMINIDRILTHRHLKTRMLLQVHDELLFEVYKPEFEEIRDLVKQEMETAVQLSVPIVVDMGWGNNWLEAH